MAAGLVAAGGLGGLASCTAAARPAASPSGPRRIRAIAFDAFPVFDPRPVAALAESLFPGRGAALIQAWRARQFEYTWLRALSGRYADFWQVTGDSLVFAARALGLDLGGGRRARLMDAHLELGTWPDVPEALRSLRMSGLRLAFLSNFTPRMLDVLVERSGLAGLFDHVLSTDRARTYKPDPRAYRLGVDAFGLPAHEILFVPFAGWDAAGAAWFGYPTFWVDRAKAPPEELGAPPEATGETLADLVEFVASRR